MAPADYRTVCQYRLPCLSRLQWECNYPGIIERENQRIAAQRWHLPAAEAQFNTTVEAIGSLGIRIVQRLVFAKACHGDSFWRKPSIDEQGTDRQRASC